MIISIKITSYIYDDLNVQPQKNILCKLGSFISNTNVNLIMRFIKKFLIKISTILCSLIQLLTLKQIIRLQFPNYKIVEINIQWSKPHKIS